MSPPDRTDSDTEERQGAADQFRRPGRPWAPAAARPAARVPPPERRATRFFWPLVSALLAGVIASMVWRPFLPETPADVSASPGAYVPLGQREDRDQGDQLLRNGDYRGALSVFRSLTEDKKSRLRGELAYRIALCLEGLDQWKDSFAEYEEIAGGDDPLMIACAQVGQARLHNRLGKPEKAEGLLWHVVLRSAEAALKDQTVVTESRYLLGLTLAMKAAASDGPPALDSTRPESLAPDWQVEDALDWITPAPAARAKPAEHVSFDRPNAANDPDVRVSAGPPDHAVATVSVQGEKLAQLLQRLAKAAELELHWSSDAARQIASEHTVTVATEDMSFTVLLAGLTDRWGLVWSLAEGNTLKIEAAEALSAAALGDHRLQTAHNVLQYALLEAPDDRWQRRGLLALGNVVLCQGDLDQAAVHYQRVCDNTASPFNVVASYNWGLVQWLKGDWEDARRSWFVVADGAPGHPLAPLALCQIGRTYLDAGELPEAAATFARVLSGRPDREVEARAVLYQALAHLLKREPHESQTVLKKHKGSFEQPRHHRAAEFLISFAHYQTLADERQRTDEAVHMARSLVALHHDDEDLRWLGAAGAVVIGRACGELHLGEKRVDVYRKALEEKLPRGAIEREMRYTLAEHEYDSADSRTAALDKWTALAQESDRWAMLARLKLAGHDLALGRREACLLGCRKVLQEWRDPAASQQALDLMGCVYEQQGNYKQAALCYARDVTAALNGPASQP